MTTCSTCPAPAVWERCTQFCGDHPYCLACAKKEKDFKQKDPSYFFWRRIKVVKKATGRSSGHPRRPS